MNVRFKDLINNYPDGCVFKALGESSGIEYFGILVTDPELGRLMEVTCPTKGYMERRLRPRSVAFCNVEVPDNHKDRTSILRTIGRKVEL